MGTWRENNITVSLCSAGGVIKTALGGNRLKEQRGRAIHLTYGSGTQTESHSRFIFVQFFKNLFHLYLFFLSYGSRPTIVFS